MTDRGAQTPALGVHSDWHRARWGGSIGPASLVEAILRDARLRPRLDRIVADDLAECVEQDEIPADAREIVARLNATDWDRALVELGAVPHGPIWGDLVMRGQDAVLPDGVDAALVKSALALARAAPDAQDLRSDCPARSRDDLRDGGRHILATWLRGIDTPARSHIRLGLPREIADAEGGSALPVAACAAVVAARFGGEGKAGAAAPEGTDDDGEGGDVAGD